MLATPGSIGGDDIRTGFEVTSSLDAPAATAVGADRAAHATVADRELSDEPTAPPVDARPLSDSTAARFDLALLLLLAAAVIAAVANLTTVRPELVIAAATLIPGWSLLSRLPRTDVLTSAALAVALSLALEIAGSLILGWTHWWHPEALGAVLAAGSAAPLVTRLARVARGRELWVRPLMPGLAAVTSSTILPLVPFAGAMILWGISLGQIDIASLGRDGLVTALPVTWFAALGIVIAGGVYVCWGRRTSGWVMAAYPLGALIVLFATVPALSEVPRYAWVYKHVGVTEFIQANGGPAAGGDIYNRFPGFFTLAALASSWMGAAPLRFAGWGEPFFALLSTLLVAALAFAVKPDRRVSAFAALLFVLANWIGQTYFSPQAAGFVIALAVMLVAFRGLPVGLAYPKLPRTLSRLRAWARDARPGPLWSSKASTLAVVGLDAVLVPTHQLSPYIVLLQFGLLVAIGAVRGLWQFVAMALVTVGFTAANFSYLNHNYGLLTSINPFSNLQVAKGYGATARSGIFEAHGGAFVAVILVMLVFAFAWRMARRGETARVVVPLLLVLAPIGILLGQRYGGEATLRAYMFSLPWQVSLIAAGIFTIRARLARVVATGVTCLIVAAGFVPAFFGADGLNIFPADEVTASAYLYAHAPSGSVVVLAAPDFPTNVGARYSLIDDSKSPLLTTSRFGHRELGPADVPAVGSAILRSETSDFLVFSTTEYRAARWAGLAPPGALQRLEAAVAASPYFRLWYANRDTRIYELVNGQLQGSAGG
jgi:hypothetical protein